MNSAPTRTVTYLTTAGVFVFFAAMFVVLSRYSYGGALLLLAIACGLYSVIVGHPFSRCSLDLIQVFPVILGQPFIPHNPIEQGTPYF